MGFAGRPEEAPSDGDFAREGNIFVNNSQNEM